MTTGKHIKFRFDHPILFLPTFGEKDTGVEIEYIMFDKKPDFIIFPFKCLDYIDNLQEHLQECINIIQLAPRGTDNDNW